jgi:hypothetical protein
MDAAYYDHRIIQHIISRNWFYSVTCKDSPVLNDAAEGVAPEKWDGNYAEFAYKPHGFSEPQRVAVRRRSVGQTDLFGWNKYTFVMTNRPCCTPREIFEIHSIKAGEENRFKEILSDLGLHHPRFMSLNANRLFYQVAAIAYNIVKAAKYLILDGTELFFLGVRSFIYRFVVCAGRLVTHNWKRTLKLPEYPLKTCFIERRLQQIQTA